eukprot:2854217-Alexandrium_andersonii.AAC.1
MLAGGCLRLADLHDRHCRVKTSSLANGSAFAIYLNALEIFRHRNAPTIGATCTALCGQARVNQSWITMGRCGRRIAP